MISTKYRKEQAARKKRRAIEKLKNPKKQEMKGPKNSHRMRMERRNKRLHQQLLFRLAERRRKIEELKRIIEENKLKKLAEEQGVPQEPNEIGDVYDGLLNMKSELQTSEEEE